MGIEIERKFLVDGQIFPQSNRSVWIKQGYLNSNPERCVRIRITGDQCFITIKGPTKGMTRAEYEYSIPIEDGEHLLMLCENEPIEKRRHYVEYHGMLWEIDQFYGVNLGLVIAEIELSAESQDFKKPEWIGQEVTYDHRYSNASLSTAPFSSWNSTS